MKKVSLIIAIILLFVFSGPVSAHQGRLDSSGGHNCTAKSKAKGLCTDYHYHYSDGTSSSGDNETSGDNIPTTTQPTGPTPEEIAALDKASGEKDGYAAGLDAGYNGNNSTPSSNGSTAYIEGYNPAYETGYKEGLAKLNAEKEVAKTEGYEFGKTQTELVVPEKYQGNEKLKEAFSSGFTQSIYEVEQEKKTQFETLGYEHGKQGIEEKPQDIEGVILAAYEAGYEKGYGELKENYLSKGYEAAFTMLSYKEPKLEKVEYIKWYEEGFNSNDEVDKIEKVAFELGKSGGSYTVPKKYAHAEPIFKHYYELGVEENKKDKAQVAGVFGIGIFGWLARRYYVSKKMIK